MNINKEKKNIFDITSLYLVKEKVIRPIQSKLGIGIILARYINKLILE